MKNGFILGAILGGAVAATASLLTTPKNGNEMRNTVKGKYEEVKAVTLMKIDEIKLAKQEKDLENAATKETTETAENINTQETQN